MKSLVLPLLAAVLVLPVTVFAQEMNDKQKTSYSVGRQMGQIFADTPELVDQDAMFQGIRDVIAGADSKVSDEDMQRLLMGLQTQIQEAQKAKMAEEYAGAKEAGETYLAENAKKDGVMVTDSGLQYKVITAGTGRTPARTDKVSTHYKGTFVDGEEFDSSYKRGQPAVFGVTQVISGWTEALTMMKEGAKWELTIPYQLAYGEGGRPPAIPPFSVLKFEIELISIVDTP